jgi:hypothetical protein
MARTDKEGKSDDEQHTTDDEKKGKSKMGALKAIAINSRKFRDSLKRRRRKQQHGSDSLLQIKDIRVAQEQKAVDEFRQMLEAENLLPAKHDDYHDLLR